MAASAINNSMRIQEIVREYVEAGQAQANKTSLDNEVVKRKEAEIAKEEGRDLEVEEVTADFPA